MVSSKPPIIYNLPASEKILWVVSQTVLPHLALCILYSIQVDKQVVAVNSSNIIIEQFYSGTRRLTEGRQGAPLQLPQHPADCGEEAPQNWALHKYSGVLPLEGNTNVCQEEDFASHF